MVHIAPNKLIIEIETPSETPLSKLHDYKEALLSALKLMEGQAL